MAASIKVADLFARLGLRPDAKAWTRGTKLIQGMQAAIGRFARRAAIATAAVGVGAGVLGDKYTELENRIRQVAGSNEELNSLMDRTRAIANATRSDWKATGEAFVRLKNATKDMGVSTDRALALVETLNMALQSSGATTQEAASGTLQLMQALGRGALQGEEFGTIAEALPDLLDLFAKELNVSRGQLKDLASQGKITTKVIVASLENASGSIRDKFAASTATAGQRWVQLKNSLMLASAEFMRATGFGDALARAVQRISTWIEGHREEIRAFGAAVGQAFGLAYDAVAAVVNFLIDHSEVVTSVMLALGAVMTAFAIKSAVAWTIAAAPVIALIAVLTAIILVIRKVARRWDDIKRAVKNAVGAALAAIKGFARAIAAPFIAAGELVRDAFMAVVNFVADKVNWVVDKAKAAANAIDDFLFGDEVIDPNSEMGRKMLRMGIKPGAQVLPGQVLGDPNAPEFRKAPVPAIAPRSAPVPSVPREQAGAGAAGVTVGAVTNSITVHAAPGMSEQQLADKVGAAVDERIRTAFINVGAERGVVG